MKVTKAQGNIIHKTAKRSALSQHATTKLQEADITAWQRQTQITKKIRKRNAALVTKKDPQKKHRLIAKKVHK